MLNTYKMSESVSFKSHISSQDYAFNLWNIEVKKSHILQSRCTSTPSCECLVSECPETSILCDFCKYVCFNYKNLIYVFFFNFNVSHCQLYFNLKCQKRQATILLLKEL